jgi:hypothetical protein
MSELEGAMKGSHACRSGRLVEFVSGTLKSGAFTGLLLRAARWSRRHQSIMSDVLKRSGLFCRGLRPDRPLLLPAEIPPPGNVIPRFSLLAPVPSGTLNVASTL